MKSKSIALIREPDCIGCGKCIDACPVDAILGSAKQMHTVIADECIGCELCLPPCPVDCIELIPMDHPRDTLHTRRRVSTRKQRLQRLSLDLTRQPLHSDPKHYLAEIMARIKSRSK